MTMTTSALTLIAATTMGVLSACGSQPAQAETPTQILHELVQCMRAHGMPNAPDPTIDSQGHWEFPQVPGVSRQLPPATVQACQSIFNRLPASMRNGSAPDIAMETRFAQCMRTHGLSDFPDPNPDGSHPLPLPAKGGPLFDRFQAASVACRAFNPSGGLLP